MKSRTKHASTPNTNERKRRQPQLQFHLVAESYGRWELGLLTLSAAVLPLKKKKKKKKCCCVRCFDLFKLFPWTANLLNVTTFFYAQIDLFTIFVCSCYRLWATIRLLHHFGLVMCVNSKLYRMHFSCHWCKIRNVSHQLTQISERQRSLCLLITY